MTLFLQTLQKRDLYPAKRDEIYGQSLQEIKRLESLVSNLLITRSIENRNYYLNKTNLPLHELIQSVVSGLQGSILKNHVCELNLAEAHLLADRESLISIITNLLQNAAKYAPVKSLIRIDLSADNNVIKLVVADQGIGISDDKKELAFRRFFRDENEMTRKSKGTGLGLFITRFLVEQHNGTIKLEDNNPQGLRVVIQFKQNELWQKK